DAGPASGAPRRTARRGAGGRDRDLQTTRDRRVLRHGLAQPGLHQQQARDRQQRGGAERPALAAQRHDDAEQERAEALGDIERERERCDRLAALGFGRAVDHEGEQRRVQQRDTHRVHERRHVQAGDAHPQAHREQPGRLEHERDRRAPDRAETVRKPGAEHPHQEHGHRVLREHRARTLQAELRDVQGHERREPGEPGGRQGEDQPRAERSRVQQPALRGGGVLGDRGARHRHAQTEQDRAEAEPAAEEPGRVHPPVGTEQLAEHRPDRESAVHRDREVRRRLAPPRRRRQVLHSGRRAYEHRGLPGTGEEAHADDRRKRGRERVAEHRDARDRPTAEHQDAPAPAVADVTDDGSQQRGGHGERTDGDPDRSTATAEGVLHEARQHGRDDAHRHEVEERGAGDLDERGREQPVPRIHALILAGSPPARQPGCNIEQVFGQLTDQQQAAARYDGGHLLIVAGAGTGKTTTLAARLAALVERGIAPERILLLTFSRRAAAELVQRADALAGHDIARRTWAGTFHAVANRLLRRHGWAVGLDPGFTILDQTDAADLLALVRAELHAHHGTRTTDRRRPKKETMAAILSRVVTTSTPLSVVLRESFPWCADDHDELRATFEAYTARKRSAHLVDYDDLLLGWSALFRSAAAATVQSQFDHVLVDEYQDTNAQQADLLQALAAGGATVTAVGDDAQAIYGFRNATQRNILEFPDRFGAGAVVLDRNHRSTPSILATANAVMAETGKRHAKTLWSTRHDGPRPVLVACTDEAAQVTAVCARILEAHEQGVAL